MNIESGFVDVALRAWKLNIDRGGKFFSRLSDEQLMERVAPGKNRVFYLWGHLTAVNDGLLPLLGVGERVHPELEARFIGTEDGDQPYTITKAEMQAAWTAVHERLWSSFQGLSPAEWLERHTAVEEADFAREPHRNRYATLLSRTSHVAYHLGQAILVRER